MSSVKYGQAAPADWDFFTRNATNAIGSTQPSQGLYNPAIAQAVLHVADGLPADVLENARIYAERPFIKSLGALLKNPQVRDSITSRAGETLATESYDNWLVSPAKTSYEGVRSNDLLCDLSDSFSGIRDEVSSSVEPAHRLMTESLMVASMIRECEIDKNDADADTYREEFQGNSNITAMTVCGNFFIGAQRVAHTALQVMAKRRRYAIFSNRKDPLISDLLKSGTDLSDVSPKQLAFYVARLGRAQAANTGSWIRTLSRDSQQGLVFDQNVAGAPVIPTGTNACPALHVPKLFPLSMQMLAESVQKANELQF